MVNCVVFMDDVVIIDGQCCWFVGVFFVLIFFVNIGELEYLVVVINYCWFFNNYVGQNFSVFFDFDIWFNVVLWVNGDVVCEFG